MSLFVVATPIGNNADFSQRSLDILKSADLVVGEELKPLRQILKAAGVQARSIDQLNEHSREADIEHLANECRDKKVALVSDCGTPGFCDPGADLVAACVQKGISVHSVPGPSSLMAFLSICGVRLDQFLFFGFLPAKTEQRQKAWQEIKAEKRPVIVMETPYRCAKLIEDLGTHCGSRKCVVGLNLTQEVEQVLRSSGRDLKSQGPYPEQAEVIALILPERFR